MMLRRACLALPGLLLPVATFAAPGPVRILSVGQPATTDFIENRLNFIIGPDGRVADISCG